MEINDRIELLIGKLGYNPHSFTKTLGLKSTSTIPNILRERDRKPSYEVLNRIASRFPEINMNWLLTGHGDMFSAQGDNVPDIVDRIRKVMNFYRYDNGNLISATGLHPQVVSDVVDNGQKPNEEFLHAFMRLFNNISDDWILRNDGRMFASVMYSNVDDPDMNGIPLYSVEYSSLGAKLGKAEALLRIKGYEDCDVAVRAGNQGFAPEIVPGDFILMKDISKDFIMYGERYVVATKDQHFVKYVRRSKKEGYVSLEAPQGNTAEPFELAVKDIARLFLIKGVVKRYH